MSASNFPQIAGQYLAVNEVFLYAQYLGPTLTNGYFE